MFAKFSVKKPYTVFVSVILVIVLGVISFFGMTTELLPTIDLPFVVVNTAYPGAGPEKVEAAVTKPLEGILGTTSGLANIQSISQDNVSTIILEYTQGTNMDSIMIELSDSIDMVSGQFDDAVGKPMLMKMNPDMMPIMVASVDIEGKDAAQVTKYVADTIIPEFERVNGVAGITATGLIEESLNVTLNGDKIKDINEKIANSVTAELDKAKADINKGKAELADGKAELESGIAEMNSQKSKTFGELAATSAQIDSANAQLSAIAGQTQSLAATKAGLEAEKAGYTGVYTQYETINVQLAKLSQGVGGTIPADVAGMIALGKDAYNTTVIPLLNLVDPALAASLTFESLTALQGGFDAAALRLPQLETGLANLNTEIAAAEAMATATEKNLADVQKAYEQIESGKLTAVNEITKVDVTLANTKAELEKAETELEKASEEFADARKEALKKADMSEVLTKDMISNILMAQNFSMPAGYIKEGNSQYIVKVGEQFDSVESVENAILLDMDIEGVNEIYLSEVADIEVTSNADEIFAKVNGNNAIMLSFQKQNTYSTTEVTDAIHSTAEDLTEKTEGFNFTPLMDQGQYIHIIIDSVLQNLLYGGVLAIAILLLFLRDIKPTLVIACSIPISLMFAITLMYFSGVNLNIISLSGLALGIGMLVDNSIVVIENIYRLRSRGASAAKAAVQGTMQVSGAIFASTLTTVCVFLPIVFVQGISRQLFADMGLTIAYSLIASLLVAMTFVPAMSSGLLKNSVAKPDKLFDKFVLGYEKVLRSALKHRAITLIFAAGMFAFSIFGITQMGTAFIPEMESPEMSVSLTMPKGTEKADSFKITDAVMEDIAAVEGVDTVGAIHAEGGGMMGGGGGSISVYVLLDEKRDTTNKEIAELITKETADAGCTVDVTASSMDMSALGGSGLEVIVKGTNLDKMIEISDDIGLILGEVEGVIDIKKGNDEADPETRVTVDKTAAMKRGLTVAQVYSEIAEALKTDSKSTTLTVGATDYPVIIIDETEQITRENLGDFLFTTTNKDGDDETFKLSEIASITQNPGSGAINRENQSRYMTVSAGVDKNHNVGLVGREFSALLDKYEAEDGYTVEMRGENETITDSLVDLTLMAALAIVFIYLIMVAQFQSLLSPFIVLFTLPLAFTGGLLLLWATGNELSVIAMLGFLVLSGVVVNNGIVFVDYTNQLRIRGMSRYDALIKCGKTRLRPILMTAMTTILAMSTMALGVGMGAEMSKPMAIVTIGGLSYATVLTLIVVPVIYDLLCKKDLKASAIEDEDDDE